MFWFSFRFINVEQQQLCWSKGCVSIQCSWEANEAETLHNQMQHQRCFLISMMCNHIISTNGIAINYHLHLWLPKGKNISDMKAEKYNEIVRDDDDCQ